jgi:hypothetical protein
MTVASLFAWVLYLYSSRNYTALLPFDSYFRLHTYKQIDLVLIPAYYAMP